MNRNSDALIKLVLRMLGGLAIELFREVLSGKVKLSIEDGYFCFDRQSQIFPINFKARLPSEEELTTYIDALLQNSQTFLPPSRPDDE